MVARRGKRSPNSCCEIELTWLPSRCLVDVTVVSAWVVVVSRLDRTSLMLCCYCDFDSNWLPLCSCWWFNDDVGSIGGSTSFLDSVRGIISPMLGGLWRS